MKECAAPAHSNQAHGMPSNMQGRDWRLTWARSWVVPVHKIRAEPLSLREGKGSLPAGSSQQLQQVVRWGLQLPDGQLQPTFCWLRSCRSWRLHQYQPAGAGAAAGSACHAAACRQQGTGAQLQTWALQRRQQTAEAVMVSCPV